MDTEKNDIIRKIRKLLALAGNNPSKNEAIAAAMMAQRLMAENGISSIESDEEDVSRTHIFTTRKNWRKRLCYIVASNFRYRGGYTSEGVVFFGYEKDRDICKEVFTSLYEIGNRLGRAEVNLYKKQHPRRKTVGLFDCYIEGFLTGLEQQLTRQAKALMIVTPEKVNEYADRNIERRRTYRSQALETRASKDSIYKLYSKGYSDGKNAVSRPIENI